MNIWGKTDVGVTRNVNQDNYFCEILEDNIIILCVCDGMGGTNGGHIASKYASREFVYEIKRQIKSKITDGDAKRILKDAVSTANNFVHEMAICDHELFDMGTTLIGGMLVESKLYLANIGDSRCYHIDKDKITQVTKDHSLVQMLIDTGKLTVDESLSHPKKNLITRAVGVSKNISSDIYKINLEKNESILLCSDGLYNMVSDEQIKHIINSDSNIDDKCNELVMIANRNGGLDNITTVILQF